MATTTRIWRLGPRLPRPKHPFRITPRELDVLRLVADGYTNAEIAQRLTIRHDTVKDHVGSILVKLEARSRAHAAVRAIGRGLLGVPL